MPLSLRPRRLSVQIPGLPRWMRSTYLFIQGLLVPLWWLGLLESPGARAFFLPGARLDPNFAALMLPDLALISLLSLAAAWLVARRSPRAVAALWLLSGALAYATLYTMAWTFLVTAPMPGLLLMLAASLGTTLVHRASI